MPSALSVAKELTKLSLEGEEPDPLTNMRLQKLLYYAQAWSMIVRGSDLFPESLEAWKLGPVVPAVYRHCKEHESETKSEKYRLLSLTDFDGIPDVTTPVDEFLANLWEAYKGYSASALYQKTHKETPWVVARGCLPPGTSSDAPIDPEVMGDYFNNETMPEAIAAFWQCCQVQELEAKRQLESMPSLDKIELRRRAIACSGSSQK